MGTNKDQAQAQAFMLGRVVSALTVHETDPEQQPFRRPLMAAIGGIVVGVLVLAGFWVFGLIVPGGDRFTATDVLIVEEETGARYVLMNGRLHPVLNYTSGLLALDQHVAVETVSRARLTGIPVGPRIGIPGAPDSLPDKEELLTGGWSMCDRSEVDDQGRRRDTPVLLVGEPPPGRPLEINALLVHAGDLVYVVHDGYRHEVVSGADVALQLDKESPVTVDGTWLDTVPAGTPIGPVPVADAGRPSVAVPGRQLLTGQLIEVDDGATSPVVDKPYYLVLPDRLQPISPLQAAVQRVLGTNADQQVTVGSRDLLDAEKAPAQRSSDDDPPWTRPSFLTVDDPDATVCATFQPGTAVPSVIVGATLPSGGQGDPVRVVVPAGRAALVQVASGPDEPAGQGTVALVTDQGTLYPLADPAHVVQVLGYDGVSPVRVPAALADRVPRGPSLSPRDARVPVTG